MPAASLDAVSGVSIDPDLPWTEPIRAAFLELSGAARGGARLETLDRVGLLERYVPAWGPVRCRPQRDPYHRSSVDVHLLASFAGVARLLDDPGDDPRLRSRSGGPRRRRPAPGRAPARHRQDRRGPPRRGRDARGRGDARPHGRGGSDGRPRALPRRGAPPPVGHGHASRSRRRASDRGRGRSRRDPERLAALYLVTMADAEATGPSRGRRGARPWSASSSPRSGTSSSATTWVGAPRNG